jgi:hypothetical protein
MGLKRGLRFFVIGVGLAVCLLVWFYATHEKQAPLRYLGYVSYLSFWTGPRLFHGPPMTKTVEFLSNVYIVVCSGLQAFLVGLSIDLFKRRSPTIRKSVNQRTGQRTRRSLISRVGGPGSRVAHSIRNRLPV